MGRSLTQFDVAKAAGVSRSTVAAVFQNRPSTSIISKDKQKRVLDAAQKLNYQPHFAARSLRMGRTHNVAFAISSSIMFGATIPAQVFAGAMTRGQELGYALTICAYQTNENGGSSFEELVRSSRFDGFFHFDSSYSDANRRAKVCEQWKKPYVVLQQKVEGIPSIYFDDVLGGQLGMKALLNSGCQRVAVVSDNPAIFYKQRLKGAITQAKEAGVEVIVMPMSNDFGESGRRAVEVLFERGEKVDGFYGGNDQVAMGCIQKLNEMGISVPYQVSVVGHDDGPMAALATPALTSVRQDGVAMGRKAMEMLHERIETGDNLPATDHKMIPELIERESTNGKIKEIEEMEIEAESALVCV